MRRLLFALVLCLAPSSRAQQRQSASRHLETGDAYLAAGDRGSAIGWYRDAISADPRDARAYEALGRAYLSRGSLGDARAVYEAGLARAREPKVLYAGLSETLERMGASEPAREVLRLWTEREPNDVAAHRARGANALRSGAFSEALASFRRVLALDPTDEEARRNITGLVRLVRTLDPLARPPASSSLRRALSELAVRPR